MNLPAAGFTIICGKRRRQGPDSPAAWRTDGSGLLLVNASRAYHLNPTAACMAYLNLEEVTRRRAVAALTRRLPCVDKPRHGSDYRALADQIERD